MCCDIASLVLIGEPDFPILASGENKRNRFGKNMANCNLASRLSLVVCQSVGFSGSTMTVVSSSTYRLVDVGLCAAAVSFS